VHVEWLKVTGIMIMNFTCVLLLAVGLLATLKIFTSA
jgi:hypothetical protein